MEARVCLRRWRCPERQSWWRRVRDFGKGVAVRREAKVGVRVEWTTKSMKGSWGEEGGPRDFMVVAERSEKVPRNLRKSLRISLPLSSLRTLLD
jgi:hypothetical protein